MALAGLLAGACEPRRDPGAAAKGAPSSPTLAAATSSATPAGAAASGGRPPSSAERATREAAPPPAGASSSDGLVRTGPIEDVFLLTGELHAVRSLDLVTPRSEMWQVQIKWIAEDGTEARQGDRVIEFDNRQVVQNIEEKKLVYIQSGIDLESRRASLAAEEENRRFTLERARTEAEKLRVQAAVPKELLSLHDWQDRQAALRRAEAELEKARLEQSSFEVSSRSEIENLEIARDKAARDIESAQRTLEALSVSAPKDGIFVLADNWQEDRKYQVGDTCWPGQTIASIPDLTAMEVVGYLSDVDDDRIRAGMPARCILDTYPDRVFLGTVEDVSTVAERKAWGRGGFWCFRARLSLRESDPAIMRPGMSVRVEVVRRAWERVLIVPKQAVRRKEEKSFVLKSGASAPVEVRIAGCTPTECVVESGLAEGDRVALR